MEREAILESQIEVLGKQVDDLKCCGNCKHYTRTQKCYNMRPGAYCPKWEPDGLTREKRSG